MFPLPDSLYARWRSRVNAATALRDDADSPPERLLQAVWQHQRLTRDRLTTLDGQSVRILHPGFINLEGGPDFRRAVVRFGSGPAVSGDVEVDIRRNGWRAHGHNRNPAFRNVILHVIWDGSGSASGLMADSASDPHGEKLENPPPPALGLREILDAPIGELSLWLHSEGARQFPESLRGQCCAPLKELPPERVSALLRDAAQIRFQSKAAQLSARARQVGWEQTLWEGLFRALGYKHNSWAMQCVAEQRGSWLENGNSLLSLQARLLGVSGLLPGELGRGQTHSGNYLRQVWDHWWRERDGFSDGALPRSLWRFHGQRPANHPQRRLALAAHWLHSGNLVSQLEEWCVEEISDARLASSLLEILQIERDDFWSWHWTLRSARLPKAQPLLGAARATDLAVNVILPWLWVRAAEGKNLSIQKTLQHRYEIWPTAEDNAVLRLARQRLLGGGPARRFRTAAEQQGLIQIVRDFCDHSNSVCDHCEFPKLVREEDEMAPKTAQR